MELMIGLAAGFALMTCLYVAGISMLLYGWNKITPLKKVMDGEKIMLTVLIPVRNESLHIEALLRDLDAQTYDCFEVLVLDDDSDDETPALVERMKNKVSFPLQLVPLRLDDEFKGSHKKKALSLGVAMAEGETIVCTDGDCRLQKEWLEGFVNAFHQKEVQFVSAGVSFMKEQDLFGHMQTIEFASLVGTGAASMALNRPNMCNGANMAFRKSAFNEVKGYEGVDHIASGDDEFLMHKMKAAFPDGLRFIKEKSQVVFTYPKATLKSFFHQRRRWAGKWSHYKNWQPKALAAVVFLYHLVLLAGLVLTVSGQMPVLWFLPPFVIKCVFDFMFLSRVMALFGKRIQWQHFIPLQFFYSFYVVFFGLSAHFGRYEWKGRMRKS